MSEYPHMCRDSHEEIGHKSDDEMCPLCKALSALGAAEGVMWMAKEYALAGGMNGPEYRDFFAASQAVRSVLGEAKR